MALFNKNKDTKAPEYLWNEVILEAYKNNTKKIVDFNCTIQTGRLIILTNDDRIIFASKKYGEENTIEEIKINDIMKVELNVVMDNKTKANMFALVPTFEMTNSINYIELKIITMDGISRFRLDNSSRMIIDYSDELEIVFTYLEKRIKNNEF
jgi:hypothetical protein